MSTTQTYELDWLSYLSNILSPAGQKVGINENSPPLTKPWRRPCKPYQSQEQRDVDYCRDARV